jgi:hypothetical protein
VACPAEHDRVEARLDIRAVSALTVASNALALALEVHAEAQMLEVDAEALRETLAQARTLSPYLSF